jgi:hypothetical protein
VRTRTIVVYGDEALYRTFRRHVALGYRPDYELSERWPDSTLRPTPPGQPVYVSYMMRKTPEGLADSARAAGGLAAFLLGLLLVVVLRLSAGKALLLIAALPILYWLVLRRFPTGQTVIEIRRQLREQLSPDRRRWRTDGEGRWQDTDVVAPPSAIRSEDSTQWWDGVEWRSLPRQTSN